MMNNKIHKPAFTLAELLIAIGIIGVLSALSLPAIKDIYEEKVYETSHKKMKGEIMSALETMQSKKQLSTQTSSESMANALSAHLKTKKICTGTNINLCFPNFSDNATPVNAADATMEGDYSSTKAALLLANGPSILLGYTTKSCATPYMYTNDDMQLLKCVAIYYDTNGLEQPNMVGKDIWYLNDEF